MKIRGSKGYSSTGIFSSKVPAMFQKVVPWMRPRKLFSTTNSDPGILSNFVFDQIGGVRRCVWDWNSLERVGGGGAP